MVSNDGANQSAWQLGNGVVTVVPMTTSHRPPYPFRVEVRARSGLPSDSVAQGEQVRLVDVRRIQPTSHVLPAPVMAERDRALPLHLALW